MDYHANPAHCAGTAPSYLPPGIANTNTPSYTIELHKQYIKIGSNMWTEQTKQVSHTQCTYDTEKKPTNK